jgi:hypothetical protein
MWFRLSIRSQDELNDLLRTVKQLPAIKHAERFLPA